MRKAKFLSVFVLLALLLSTLVVPSPAWADGGNPPSPITVTSEIDHSGAAPSGVVPGPGGEQVTITNQYYPYYGGSVKSNGWADANFYQLPWSRMTCQSHVYNSAGQHGTYTNNQGSYGGNNCPETGLAVLGGVVPTYYTTWTKSWWRWSDETQGYGIAEQTHYED